MNASIGRDADEREAANKLLNELDDRAALKLLREETTLLILMVRIANQDRKEIWERKKQESEGTISFLEDENEHKDI